MAAAATAAAPGQNGHQTAGQQDAADYPCAFGDDEFAFVKFVVSLTGCVGNGGRAALVHEIVVLPCRNVLNAGGTRIGARGTKSVIGRAVVLENCMTEAGIAETVDRVNVQAALNRGTQGSDISRRSIGIHLRQAYRRQAGLNRRRRSQTERRRRNDGDCFSEYKPNLHFPKLQMSEHHKKHFYTFQLLSELKGFVNLA